MKKTKKVNIKKLRMEIQIKDAIIKELLVEITKNKVKVPDKILNMINILYAGGLPDGKKKEGTAGEIHSRNPEKQKA
jgi:hypothetical protein